MATITTSKSHVNPCIPYNIPEIDNISDKVDGVIEITSKTKSVVDENFRDLIPFTRYMDKTLDEIKDELHDLDKLSYIDTTLDEVKDKLEYIDMIINETDETIHEIEENIYEINQNYNILKDNIDHSFSTLEDVLKARTSIAYVFIFLNIILATCCMLMLSCIQ